MTNNNGDDRLTRLEAIVESLALSVTEIKNLERDNGRRIEEILHRIDRQQNQIDRHQALSDRALAEIRELNADVKELATENRRILRYLEGLVNRSE